MARLDRHFRLTPDAAAAWDRLVTRHNVSLTALAEALGELLAEDVDWVPPEAVSRARAIDAARRSRR